MFSLLSVTLLSLSFFATLALSQDLPQNRRVCGTFTTEKDIDAAERLVESSIEPRDLDPLTSPQPVIIDTYFHIISAGKGLGDIPDSNIKLQMDVLNKAFHKTGFQFALKGTNHVVNPDWFHNAYYTNPQANAMKASMRMGGLDPKILNIYTVGFTYVPKHLGHSLYPWYSKTVAEADGVVMHYSAIAGGLDRYYNMGLTLVHEVGHWAGLLHTYQGGCDGKGDRVKDTPNEQLFAYTCNWRKTCPGPHLSDSINNFMSENPQSCTDTFTDGQVVRMTRYLRRFRNIHNGPRRHN